MRVLQGRKQQVNALAFSPDGRHLAAGGTAGCVELWDLAAGTAAKALRTGGSVYGMAFTPGGGALLAWSSACVVRFTAPDWVPDGRRLGGGLGALSPDGAVLVTAHHRSLAAWAAPVDFWRVWSWEVEPEVALGMGRPAFAPDGERLAVLRYPQLIVGLPVPPKCRRIEVRSAASGAVRSGFDLPAGTHHDLSGWSPDGRWLVTTGKQLLVWEASTGGREAEHAARPRAAFSEAAFHPTAPFLLAAAEDGTVRLYRTDSWQEAERYAWGLAKAKSVAVAPDGMKAAAGGDDGRIVVWDFDP